MRFLGLLFSEGGLRLTLDKCISPPRAVVFASLYEHDIPVQSHTQDERMNELDHTNTAIR